MLDLAEAKQKPVAMMSFEEALAELEQIVGGLEGGTIPLEQSIAMYERGEALRGHCAALLKKAEVRIEKITVSDGAATGTEPLDAGDT